jgi:hypothetical protein
MYAETFPASRAETHKRHKRILHAMDKERQPWFSHWREVADYFLPRRYPYLMTKREQSTAATQRNRKLLNSTTTLAVRTLASGMMNGITSPARPWFRLRISGVPDSELSKAAKGWLKEVERRMLVILAESNFYNSMAVMYLEWCTFGTAAMVIYEDFRDVVRCYNFALGEFFISQDNTQRVNRLGRHVNMTVEQLAAEFGEESLCTNTRNSFRRGGEHLLQWHPVAHIIEENDPDDGLLPGNNAPYREVYWEIAGGEDGKYLAVRPLYEWPAVVPRWELHSQDSYGTSPAMDALGDAIELQQTVLDMAQGRANEVRPALLVDSMLRNRPKALGAGGLTYVPGVDRPGARRVYDAQFPFQENAAHMDTLERRIRETCHNNLFNMISQLDTVRSATEIDARREEKLVHLGPVLERFENEGLDPALSRVFRVAQRADLLPPPPEELDATSIDVQYVSVLSDAQRAVGTVSIERFLTLVGNVAGVFPEATQVPNVAELVREYAEGIGISPEGILSAEEVSEKIAAQEEAESLAATAAVGKDLAQGAQAASQVDVGGGQNAVQALLGG